MRSWGLVVFVFVFSFCSFSAIADDVAKIGFVDLERAVNEIAEGAKAKMELQKEFDAKQGVLDKKQEELKNLQDDLQKQSAVLSAKAKEQKMAGMQKKMAEVQQLYMTMQQAMVKRQQEVMGPILAKMNTLIASISKEQGYVGVFDKGPKAGAPMVLFSLPHLDLTNEIIRRYNDAYGTKNSSQAKG